MKSPTVTLPALLTQREVAEYLHKSEAWLERARVEGGGPKFIKCGRAVRYRADDLQAWMENNARQSTAEARRA